MLETLFPLLLLIFPLAAVIASLIVLGIKWKMKLNKMQGKVSDISYTEYYAYYCI